MPTSPSSSIFCHNPFWPLSLTSEPFCTILWPQTRLLSSSLSCCISAPCYVESIPRLANQSLPVASWCGHRRRSRKPRHQLHTIEPNSLPSHGTQGETTHDVSLRQEGE